MGSQTITETQETPFILALRDQEKRFSLLDLPRELRDEVYDYCFDNVVYSFSDAGCVFRITAGSPHHRQQHKRLPQWLLGCKTLLSEGIDRFYKRSVCTIWSRSATSSKPPGSWALLRLHHVLTLHLTANLAVTPIERSAKLRNCQPKISLHPHSAYTTHINNLVDFFSDRNACLRSLKFAFQTPYSFSCTTTSEFGHLQVARPDLSVLRRFGSRLEKVEFAILEPQIDTSLCDELLSAELAFTAIQDELIDVAKSLVSRGLEETGLLVRDWLWKNLKPDHEIWGQRDVPGETGFVWTVEVSSITGASRESIQHKGIPTWGDIGGKDTRFHGREESSTGEVKWHSNSYGVISVTPPDGTQADRFCKSDRTC